LEEHLVQKNARIVGFVVRDVLGILGVGIADGAVARDVGGVLNAPEAGIQATQVNH
jgi:hypothetical protein